MYVDRRNGCVLRKCDVRKWDVQLYNITYECDGDDIEAGRHAKWHGDAFGDEVMVDVTSNMHLQVQRRAEDDRVWPLEHF